MKEFIEKSGKSLKEFSQHYGIPYNTVQQWANGTRNAPSWMKGLIEKVANGTQLEIEYPTLFSIEFLDEDGIWYTKYFTSEEERDHYFQEEENYMREQRYYKREPNYIIKKRDFKEVP